MHSYNSKYLKIFDILSTNRIIYYYNNICESRDIKKFVYNNFIILKYTLP